MKKIRVSFHHNNSVAQIILDDGKGNILDHVMMDELQNVFNSFKEKEEIKLITFEGAGKHFSFGASVEEHKKENAAQMLRAFHQLFYSVADLSIPTMAKISGQCLGGGMELALICNFLFADKTAMLGQPEIILGVFAPPASVILPMKIGRAKAEELLLTGKTISADEALNIGLLNKVFADKAAMDIATDAWIQQYIVPKSASSLRMATSASRSFFNHILTKFLPGLEQMYVQQLMETQDANEGINSFLEKRKPVWQNN